MYKEIVISILIIVLIVISDYITQKYTEKTINELVYQMDSLRQFLESGDKVNVEEKIMNLSENIEKIHDGLAYYIEHDEIEKAETGFTECKSYTKLGKYDMAIYKLDKTVFILQHIADKYSFSLENIF